MLLKDCLYNLIFIPLKLWRVYTKSNSLLHTTALALALILILEPMALAAGDMNVAQTILLPKQSLQLNLSEANATIIDVYTARPSNTIKAPTIILIQDAHINPSAQMNIAKAVESIMLQTGIQKVYAEAAFGDNSLTSLRAYGTSAQRELVARELLNKSEINGIEYLSLSSELDFNILGVEDRRLYQESLQVYREVAQSRSDFKPYLAKIKTTLQFLKTKIYNSSLREFDEYRSQYLNDQIGLTDYFEHILNYARKYHINLNVYPELNQFKKIRDLEGSIDFDQASIQSQYAFEQLDKLSQDSLAQAHARSLATNRIKTLSKYQAAYYFALESLLRGQVGHDSKYPELYKYFHYLHSVEGMRAAQVLMEQRHLEKSIYETIATTMDEKRLIQFEDDFNIIANMVSLQATPQEFQRYKIMGGQKTIVSFMAFLNKLIMDLNHYYERTLLFNKEYDSVVGFAERFYDLAYERDEAFVADMLKSMSQERSKEAILITGGFHTPHIKSLLKQMQISYIEVIPQIFAETDHAKYEQLLLNQTPPLLEGIEMQAEQKSNMGVLYRASRGNWPEFEHTLRHELGDWADRSRSIEAPPLEVKPARMSGAGFYINLLEIIYVTEVLKYQGEEDWYLNPETFILFGRQMHNLRLHSEAYFTKALNVGQNDAKQLLRSIENVERRINRSKFQNSEFSKRIEAIETLFQNIKDQLADVADNISPAPGLGYEDESRMPDTAVNVMRQFVGFDIRTNDGEERRFEGLIAEFIDGLHATDRDGELSEALDIFLPDVYDQISEYIEEIGSGEADYGNYISELSRRTNYIQVLFKRHEDNIKPKSQAMVHELLEDLVTIIAHLRVDQARARMTDESITSRRDDEQPMFPHNLLIPIDEEFNPEPPTANALESYYKKFNQNGVNSEQDTVLSWQSRRADIARRVFVFLQRYKKSLRPLNILSIGPGYGTLEAILAKAGDSVVGLELLEQNAEITRATAKEYDANVEVIIGDAHAMPDFGGRKFDLIFFGESIGHMDTKIVLNESKKHLINGGHIVISTYTYGSEDSAADFEKTLYRKQSGEQLSVIANELGLEENEAEHLGLHDPKKNEVGVLSLLSYRVSANALGHDGESGRSSARLAQTPLNLIKQFIFGAMIALSPAIASAQIPIEVNAVVGMVDIERSTKNGALFRAMPNLAYELDFEAYEFNIKAQFKNRPDLESNTQSLSDFIMQSQLIQSQYHQIKAADNRPIVGEFNLDLLANLDRDDERINVFIAGFVDSFLKEGQYIQFYGGNSFLKAKAKELSESIAEHYSLAQNVLNDSTEVNHAMRVGLRIAEEDITADINQLHVSMQPFEIHSKTMANPISIAQLMLASAKTIRPKLEVVSDTIYVDTTTIPNALINMANTLYGAQTKIKAQQLGWILTASQKAIDFIIKPQPISQILSYTNFIRRQVEVMA